MRLLRTFCARTLLLPVVLVAGCADSVDRGPQRHAVTGTITFRGQPLDQGAIQFAPAGPAGKHGGGAIIDDGSYAIPVEKGLPAGTYKVMIFSADEGDPVPGEAPGESPVSAERIPPEFNVRSDKTVEITPDGENKFDFSIQ